MPIPDYPYPRIDLLSKDFLAHFCVRYPLSNNGNNVRLCRIFIYRLAVDALTSRFFNHDVLSIPLFGVISFHDVFRYGGLYAISILILSQSNPNPTPILSHSYTNPILIPTHSYPKPIPSLSQSNPLPIPSKLYYILTYIQNFDVPHSAIPKFRCAR